MTIHFRLNMAISGQNIVNFGQDNFAASIKMILNLKKEYTPDKIIGEGYLGEKASITIEQFVVQLKKRIQEIDLPKQRVNILKTDTVKNKRN